MSKNAEGWIRHRGGKCPVEADVSVDVRYRSGQVNEHVKALESCKTGSMTSHNASSWSHYGSQNDIMAYRLHKPAEQDVIKDLDAAISIASDGRQSAMAKAIHEKAIACGKPELQIKLPENYGEIIGGSVEGPLQWRDRITEIDATAKALTTELAELVQKLASEGFALIGRAVELVEDMSDWRNWREGDLLEVTGAGSHQFPIGVVVRFKRGFESDGKCGICEYIDGSDYWYLSDSHVKFHSRPSA